MKLPQLSLPTPKTALGKAAYRALIVGLVAAIGVLLNDPAIGQGGLVYLGLKTLLDILNSDIKNF